MHAAQCIPGLKDNSTHEVASYMTIFVHGSAANERIGYKSHGWPPVRITPCEHRVLGLSAHWFILPPYTVDSFVTWDIGYGSSAWQEKFITIVVNVTLRLKHSCQLKSSSYCSNTLHTALRKPSGTLFSSATLIPLDITRNHRWLGLQALQRLCMDVF